MEDLFSFRNSNFAADIDEKTLAEKKETNSLQSATWRPKIWVWRRLVYWSI